MESKDLPQELQGWLHDLKHGSGTLQSDILDVIENAETLNQAICGSIDSMSEIIGEAAHNIEWLNSYKPDELQDHTPVESEKPVGTNAKLQG